MPTHAKVRLVLRDEHEDAIEHSPETQTRSLPVRKAIFLAREWLLEQQHPAGNWEGEIEGDATHESQYLLLMAWLNKLGTAGTGKAAKRLIDQQLPDGGWARFPGGDVDTSASVQAYFALKLTGHEPYQDYMQRAREAIMRHGGADATDRRTRWFLSLLGQIPPTQFATRGTQIAPRPGIRELFMQRPDQWAALLAQPAVGMTSFDGLIDRIVGLKCQGHGDDSPTLVNCLEQLQALAIEDETTLRLRPGTWPLRDTTWAMRALCEAGLEPDELALRDAAAWLLEQVDHAGEGQSAHETALFALALCRQCSPAPTLHDLPLPGLRLFAESPAEDEHATSALEESTATLDQAEQQLLASQHHDGGWGVFEASTPDVTGRVLEALAALCSRHAPRHNLTLPLGEGRGEGIKQDDVESTLAFTLTRSQREREQKITGSPRDDTIDRAVAYLRQTQEADGSWLGHWGVNCIYGTWQALTGLAAVGVPLDDPAIVAGANWLLGYQQACGGWGESPRSYEDRAWRGQGPVTATQTAWAILGLLAAGLADHPAVLRGVRYLVSSQEDDGTWHEPEFTGVTIPCVSYHRSAQRLAFPLLAIARWFGYVR